MSYRLQRHDIYLTGKRQTHTDVRGFVFVGGRNSTSVSSDLRASVVLIVWVYRIDHSDC